MCGVLVALVLVCCEPSALVVFGTDWFIKTTTRTLPPIYPSTRIHTTCPSNTGFEYGHSAHRVSSQESSQPSAGS